MLEGPAPRTEPAPPPPPPPPPPTPDPARQQDALGRIDKALDDSGVLWGAFQSVDRGEVQQVETELRGLNGPDASAVVTQMRDSGRLEKFARESVEGGGLFGGPDGLTVDERRDFLQSMAGKLDAPALQALTGAYRAAGRDHALEVADAVAAGASPQTKTDYVRALAADGGLRNDRGSIDANFGSTTSRSADVEAQAAGRVLASLRGDDAARAFAALSPEDRQAVFAAAGDARTTYISGGMYGGGTSLVSADARGYAALMTAAGSIPDPATRAAVVSDGLDALAGLRDRQGIGGREASEMARAALGAADAETLTRLRPNGMGVLASALAADPAGAREAFRDLSARPSHPANDALIRTTFLKTGSQAFERDPQLRFAAGRALAQTFTADETQRGAMATSFGQMLGTNEGRALLTDPKVSPTARLWALQQTAADPAAMRGLIAGDDKPWENHGLLERYAQGRVEQFSAARGNAPTTLSGGTDFDNFVGAGLGAPVRADLPADQAALERAQAQAGQGQYNFYQGVEAVQKPADGLREAQRQVGGGDVRVSVLPVQFSSQSSGPVDLQLYRVDGANGQSRYVDNIGRVYGSFDAWTQNNELPPGKMTYPAGGQLSADGRTPLETRNTPNVSDSFWEHVRDVADVAALVGGVAASGVIIFASGGTATPLVAGAWGVAIGSAAYAGGRAIGDLHDRAQHGQTLSLSDPEARAAWFSLAGAGLTVAGAGTTRLAGLAANGGRLSANTARAAGILNASANWTDAAAAVDQANTLRANWDRLSPAERAQMGLSIAFWGGMTGVSARASGGSLTDAFSFRAQINHAMIDSGAAVARSPTLQGDAVSIRIEDGGRVRIEHGPQATPESLRLHQDIAQAMVADQGARGLVGRYVARNGEPEPGTAAWNSKFEVEKLSRAIQDLQTEAARPNLTAAQRTDIADRLDSYRADLNRHTADLQRMVADPAQGQVDAPNTRRIAVSADATLGANDVTVVRIPGTGGAPDRFEVRHGSAVDPNGHQVRFFRRTAAELTAADNTLQARLAARPMGPPVPGSTEARAAELVRGRATATQDFATALAAAPNQAARNDLATAALADQVARGREAHLLFDAMSRNPALAGQPPREALRALRVDAANGRLNEQQVNDMARLGEMSGSEVQVARQRMGVAGANGSATERVYTDVAALNRDANAAAPFTRYRLDVTDAAGRVTGSYSWATDHLGRVATVTGTVTGPEAGRQPSLQARIGNEPGFLNEFPQIPNGATPRDIGFHIVADQAAGPTNHLNVVPGNGFPIPLPGGGTQPNLNNGAWKTAFETQYKRAAADPNNRVEIQVEVDYAAGNVTRRPDSFEPAFRVNGGPWVRAGVLPNPQ